MPSALSGGDQAQALIAGTVFRDPGFALPRAEVTVSTETPTPGKKPIKPQRIYSDARGEFALRVPAGAAKYRVAVKAEGFAGDERTVEIAADERIDVYFTLKPRLNK